MNKFTKIGVCIIVALAISSTAYAASYDGKKVLFIDSYHAGYVWSDGIVKGVQQTLADSGAELKVIHMDTKRNTEETFMIEAAQKAKATIESFQPDIVIAADDNVSKYLIQPFYKDAALPVVFCGVNWDAAVYGYPYKNVTGMVEVAGAKELVEILQVHAKGSRVGILADNTLSSKKDAENYASKLGLDVTPMLANSFDEWKQNFNKIQAEFDILLMGNIVGIDDFNQQEAEAFVLNNSKIPSGAIQIDMMPYVLLGYLKVAEEQGEWSAQAALKILGGTSPADIPIVNNTKGAIMVNAKIAAKTGIELPYEIIDSAEKIIE